jgi:hypothetical protein
MSTAEAKKATACSGNYQDNVTAPLSQDHNNDATAAEDPDEDLRLSDDANDDSIPAVERVSTTHSLMN